MMSLFNYEIKLQRNLLCLKQRVFMYGLFLVSIIYVIKLFEVCQIDILCFIQFKEKKNIYF